MDVKQKRVLIIGLGLSGRAAAAFLLKRGAKVSALDQNQELLDSHPEVSRLRTLGLKTYLEHPHKYLEIPFEYDLVVVSPGVPPSNPSYVQAKNRGIEILGEVELACRFLKQTCLGITGSNGKTTTTLLVEHVLNTCARPARAIGNVGTPMTAALEEVQGDEILIAELSSWQLETLSTPVLTAAAVLNITPNHLDRHGTLEEYAAAKLNIRKCLKPGAPLFMGEPCFTRFKSELQGFPVVTYGYSPTAALYTDKIQVFYDQNLEFILPESYRGWVTHDVENLLAAYALCKTQGIFSEEFLKAFKTFRKPPHRIEFVRTWRGVNYYDDSKGTSLDAVEKAVLSMKGPTILIAGGLHKGAAYTPWLTAFAGKVRCVCAIGQAAELIQNDLGQELLVKRCGTLEGAVEYASQMARKGDNVLLSPGCASYDMFVSYHHRGEEFQRIVNALTK